jgi:diketogulonate reductase-like aldo/keto reductase
MNTIDINGVAVPRFFYGTAWKEDRTAGLVSQAILAGFRGIDTANQRKHYHEAGTGAAIAKAIEAGVVTRDELFVQTKYTYIEGQDARLPYDPDADHPTQVRQSFDSSLSHLGIDGIDSYILHGPQTRSGFSRVDRDVWQTMEALQRDGRTRLIGVSNVSAEQLSILCEIAETKPAIVQNRCYARMGWDRRVREVCAREGVVYQGFSLLTANVGELESSTIGRIAAAHGVSRTRIIFRFALQIGMLALTGTTDPEHMKDDLAAFDFELSHDEMAVIERISG